jgi:hypothetical protein
MPKLTPSNVQNFMATNVVKTDATITSGKIPYEDRGKKLVWAQLELSDGSTVTNEPNGRVYFLKLVSADVGMADPEAFRIYWVEYEANGPGTGTWLGDDEHLMFTALMSGCSFGLGSYTNAGVMAAHVNSMKVSPTGNPGVEQTQDQFLKLQALGATTKVIEPDHYMPGAFDPTVRTTPFGFRPQLSGGVMPNRKAVGGVSYNSGIGGLPWKFYWLKYKGLGRSVIHDGVKQHAGGLF